MKRIKKISSKNGKIFVYDKTHKESPEEKGRQDGTNPLKNLVLLNILSSTQKQATETLDQASGIRSTKFAPTQNSKCYLVFINYYKTVMRTVKARYITITTIMLKGWL